jgi:hypothetical protein
MTPDFTPTPLNSKARIGGMVATVGPLFTVLILWIA